MSKKTTRKAMLTSVVALVICFAMLVGTTYAWFTDSVASSGNIIKSGTLNIDLLIKTDTDNDYVSVKNNPTKKAFDYDLWEPGYTEWVNAKVSTTGNLALKYTMTITANGQVSALANVIDVYYKPAEVALPATRDLSGLVKIGTLADALAGTIVIDDTLIPDLQAYNGTAVTDADYATLALHMQESAGNEYQNLSIGTDFSLTILATQLNYERDSFDDQYDAGLTFSANGIQVTDTDGVVHTYLDAPIPSASGYGTMEGNTISSASAFAGTTYTIDPSVNSIGANAFSGTQIETVTVTSNLSCAAKAFDNLNTLKNVNFDQAVTKIPNRMFYRCGIEEIVIPNTITTIEEGAFQQCASLTSVTLPSNITEIPNNLFYECTSLSSVTIPASVTKIGNNAIRGTKITSVTIPASVEEIGSMAFRDDYDLTDIYFETTDASGLTIAGNAFTMSSRVVNLKVHCKNDTVKTQMETLIPSSGNLHVTYVVD